MFYVFYEQYLTIWQDTVWMLGLSVISVAIITLIMMGFDVASSLIIMVMVVLILTNLGGLMYLWDISLNAISLVNLIVAIGISVEFCSHTTRAFAVSAKSSRLERAQAALVRMGPSVLSGITLSDMGVVVLAFAHSKIFQVGCHLGGRWVSLYGYCFFLGFSFLCVMIYCKKESHSQVAAKIAL